MCRQVPSFPRDGKVQSKNAEWKEAVGVVEAGEGWSTPDGPKGTVLK